MQVVAIYDQVIINYSYKAGSIYEQTVLLYVLLANELFMRSQVLDFLCPPFWASTLGLMVGEQESSCKVNIID